MTLLQVKANMVVVRVRKRGVVVVKNFILDVNFDDVSLDDSMKDLIRSYESEMRD